MGENRPDLTLDGHDVEPYQTMLKDKGGNTRQERHSTQTVEVIPLVRRGHRGARRYADNSALHVFEVFRTPDPNVTWVRLPWRS